MHFHTKNDSKAKKQIILTTSFSM